MNYKLDVTQNSNNHNYKTVYRLDNYNRLAADICTIDNPSYQTFVGNLYTLKIHSVYIEKLAPDVCMYQFYIKILEQAGAELGQAQLIPALGCTNITRNT